MQNFIILTMPRSGSTWLGSLLDDHSDVNVYGELFLGHSVPEQYQTIREKDPLKFFEYRTKNNGTRPAITNKYLDHVFNSSHVTGFKIMAGAFLRHPEILLYCNKHNIKVISLTRPLKERTLSYLVAETRKKFHQLDEDIDQNKQLHIAPQLLKKFVKRQKILAQGLQLYKSALKSPLIEIQYSNLKHQQEQTLKQLYQFLDIQTHVAHSSFKKISENYSNLISNYDEVSTILERIT